MLRGHVDAVSSNQIAGWAADDAAPSSLVDVSIFVNDTKIAQVTCDRPRLDLKRTLSRDELDCGFRFALDPALDLARPHRVTVRFTESGRPLPGGDVMLANADSPQSPPDFNARPPARFLPLPTPETPRRCSICCACIIRRMGCTICCASSTSTTEATTRSLAACTVDGGKPRPPRRNGAPESRGTRSIPCCGRGCSNPV